MLKNAVRLGVVEGVEEEACFLTGRIMFIALAVLRQVTGLGATNHVCGVLG
jgi:hypothetical protein